MRVALAQLNTHVGDLAGNEARVASALRDAASVGADLTLVPELALTGYPPEDLLLRPGFARAGAEALGRLAREVRSGAALIGFAEWDEDCFNSAAVVADGRVQAVYRKRFLPNYGVFDEARYFQAGTRPLAVEIAGARVGVVVCEDIWYPSPVSSELAAARLDLICCLAASPFHRGKAEPREAMLATRAADCAAALAFCNQVGGQDGLVFDGRSAVFDPTGALVGRAPQFAEALHVVDVEVTLAVRRRLREPLARRLALPALTDLPRIATGDAQADAATRPAARAPAPEAARPAIADPPAGPEAEVWEALRLGLRDYIDKNGFPGVVLGLSGGIDSAVAAALAVDALGPERVLGVAMPSRHSSPESLAGAAAAADLLGIRLVELPITAPVAALEATLAETFAGRAPDVTEENLQARARGILLMALSNKFGSLVLATGNKSEVAVGYATLYGDMVGGIAPLGDVLKTWVYRLARWRNTLPDGLRVPAETIVRPPTAELRPGQLDTDSLPPYDVLDRILEGFVEEDLDAEELAARGLPADVAEAVMRRVDRAEYKRRQGALVIKVTPRAFGRDRRMPISTRHA